MKKSAIYVNTQAEKEDPSSAVCDNGDDEDCSEELPHPSFLDISFFQTTSLV